MTSAVSGNAAGKKDLQVKDFTEFISFLLPAAVCSGSTVDGLCAPSWGAGGVGGVQVESVIAIAIMHLAARAVVLCDGDQAERLVSTKTTLRQLISLMIS